MRRAALLLSALCMAPAIAAADEVQVNPRELGVTESILNYCAGIDAGAAAKLHEKAKLLLRGVSAETAEKVRKTGEYRTAYSSVTDFVSKVDKHNAARPCGAALVEIKLATP